MSAALLRGDLNVELEELNERYSDQTYKNNKKSNQKNNYQENRKLNNKSKRRFRRNPKVDDLAKALETSPSALKKLEKETIVKNSEKLLKLSSKTKSRAAVVDKSKVVAFDSIFDQIASSKRCYEPKGRNLLKSTEKKKAAAKSEGQTSAFSEHDFEEFRKSFFANSAPIAKSKK